MTFFDVPARPGGLRNSERSKGFTLLEVLLAVSLLSIIMVLLFSSLRLAGRTWDSGEYKAQQASNRALVNDFLRNYITAAQPLEDNFTNEGEEPVFTFHGNNESLQFVSTLPSYRGSGGLHFFYLRLEDPEELGVEGKILTLSLSPFFPMFEDAAAIEDLVILEGVKEMTLSYYGLEEGEEDLQWLEQWEEKKLLPQLVRIDFEFESGEVWPPIFIRPQIEAQPT